MFEAVRETIAKKTVRHSKGREPVGRNDGRFGVQSAFADVSIHYHAGSPGPVVQMVRKRVKGRVDVFTGADIYFDKGDGGYYHDMTQEGKGEVTLSDAEYAEYIRISSKEGRSVKTTILAKAEQSGKTKFVRNIEKKEESAGEESVREESVKEESVEEESTKEEGVKEESTEKEEPAEKSIVANADIFTDGTPMEHPPKAVRLYAEGDMRHAASLARAFEQPGKYGLFERLGEEMTVGGANPGPGGRMGAGSAVGGANPAGPEALVKATEYDNLDGSDGLEGRYGEGTRSDIGRRIEEKERLEASFGGSTGDMARERPHHATQSPKRLYDIIQATFFWLPGKTNKENLEMLGRFMLNQKDKLKDGGKIRIVLTDKDSGRKGEEGENCYRWVADQLMQDTDLQEIYNFKKIVFEKPDPYRYEPGKVFKVGQTYAEKLDSLGMNQEGFVHTRTDKAEEVTSRGDLMIEATRRTIQG